MRIQKVRLKNGYKRFHDLTIDLGKKPARIVALVGPNGCGKSSVLDGLLFRTTNYSNVGKDGRRDNNYHSMDQKNKVGFGDIDIEFTKGSFDTVFSDRVTNGTVTTVFSFRSPYRYNSNLLIKETKTVSGILLNNYGAGDSSSIDSKMEDNYRRLQAAYSKYMREMDVAPSVAKAKIVAELNTSIKKCLDVEISDIGNVEEGRGSLWFRKPDHTREFNFDVLSSGEKEVVDILLDLYLRKEDYNDTIFLFDEPELHISTAIQRKLLREINGLVGENCQIWITTHSIGFLRALQDELKDECQIVQFKAELELGSKPFTLRPATTNAALWRDLFEIAIDDLANLVSPKTIVYCEGRDAPGHGGKERGLDAKVYNEIFGQAHPECLFVSSGGNTELDQRSGIAISILGKVFPTLEILVLKDRDVASGRPMNDHDRKTYLDNNSDNHRMLKRLEIENYLFDKEVLHLYCDDSGLNFDEVSYDSFVTDIANQSVKDEVGKIKNFCSITFSINPEAFKLKLSRYITKDTRVFAELDDCIFRRA